MNKNTKTVLELIRLPGMFTAHADIWAGFLLSGAELKKLDVFFLLILATSCFLSAGMTLNDSFDHKIDQIENPGRPIPSNRISRQTAFFIGGGLLIVGIVFAFMAGPDSFLVGICLALCILLYDGFLKKYLILGPLAMASCRYFNLLLGMSVAPFRGWAIIPLITGLYIFGVTVLSRKEVAGGKALPNIWLCALMPILSALLYYLLYLEKILPNFPGVIMIFCFAAFLSGLTLNLLKKNTPKDFQKTIKILLLAIITLDMIIAAGSTPFIYAAMILLLYVPAIYFVRLFRVT
ncbi:UbiA family prenyltransferase [Desulfobacter curvatus]|uniref:UbiA family prenyltransferase n=1 Tax=Desulfobacter curvatus TaxID=2290 RepID=UPI00037DC938|nr:UbiA family prenyltransferase [Desulfobacter curvatus]